MEGDTNVLSPSVHKPILERIERTGAERNVIAYTLSNPDAIFDVSAKLAESDFGNTIHQKIFDKMLHLMKSGHKVNPTTIVAMFDEHDSVSPAKVEEYLDVVSETNTVNLDLDYNMELVKRASVKRKSYSEALGIMQDSADDKYDESVDTFLGRQEQRFLDLSLSTSSADKVVKLGSITDRFLEERASNPREIIGLQTGFDELDKEIGGLQNGKLYVIMARSKVGKSVLSTNWALNIANVLENPVLYIDTEMNDEEILSRVLANLSNVYEKEIINGMFTQDDEKYEKVLQARDRLSEIPFLHSYLPGFTADQVVSLARKHKIKDNISALFFDYIKLDQSAKASSNIPRELGRIAGTLKDLAGILDIPVVTAVQMNRDGLNETEMHEGQARGSDEIFHLCNYFFGLRNKTDEEMKDTGEFGNQSFELIGSRNGGEYAAYLQYTKPVLRYEEMLRVA